MAIAKHSNANNHGKYNMLLIKAVGHAHTLTHSHSHKSHAHSKANATNCLFTQIHTCIDEVYIVKVLILLHFD